MFHLSNIRRLNTPPKPLEVNGDVVYVRYDIYSNVRNDGKIEYIYQEDQYSIQEYLKQIIPENKESFEKLNQLLDSYQQQSDLAIAELSIALTSN